VEYVAAIVGVGLVMLGLLVVRPYVVPRKDPVGAVPYVVRLLGSQARRLDPPRARAAPKDTRRPRPRRTRPHRPRVVVKLPEWLVR
jgi:hypothetical protein